MSESEVHFRTVTELLLTSLQQPQLSHCLHERVCVTEKRHKKISHKCWDAILDHFSPLKPVAADNLNKEI